MNPIRPDRPDRRSRLLAFSPLVSAEEKRSCNPVFEGWYADPEGIIFGDRYWIYPTYSAPYDRSAKPMATTASPASRSWSSTRKA
jgi:hypothetical protein